MTMVEIGEGRSLWASRDRGCVTLGLGRVEVEFVGDDLDELRWWLQGSRNKQVISGSNGGRIAHSSIEAAFVMIAVSSGETEEECELSRTKWGSFVREVVNEITAARVAVTSRPIIDDPYP